MIAHLDKPRQLIVTRRAKTRRGLGSEASRATVTAKPAGAEPFFPLARITPSIPPILCYLSASFGTCMCRGDQSRPESLPAFGPYSHPRMVISTADGSTPNISARPSFAC